MTTPMIITIAFTVTFIGIFAMSLCKAAKRGDEVRERENRYGLSG